MTKPLTPMQEKFCQNVASGMTYADSLRESYDTSNYKDKSIYEKASQMMSDVKIMSRVDEIKAECVKDIKYGVEECFNEFEELRKDAIADKDRNIQKACIENKGKLKQLFVERKVIDNKITMQEASDDAFKEAMENTK